MLGLSTLALAEIAAPALVVALSPIPVVIALVLLIHNDRPYASSIAYLVGRLGALAVLVSAFYSVPRPSDTLRWSWLTSTHWMTVAVGVMLVVMGALVLRRRGTAEPKAPWHSQLGGIPPLASAALGLLPALANPKVVAASMAVNVQTRALPSTAAAIVTLICYLALATSTVIAPIALYLILGARIDPKLEDLRDWIQRHQRAATATTLIVIGVTIVLYGIAE